MNKHHNKSIRRISSSLLTGSVIALLIAATPYIFYSYRSLPHEKTWETFLFTYTSTFYQNVDVSAWTMMGKFIPLLLIIIWFVTCRDWWYHVILIPIGMFAFQLISVINDDVSFTDEVELWWLFPIMLVIVPFVYLTRAKIISRRDDADLGKFEKELMEKKTFWGQIGDLFR